MDGMSVAPLFETASRAARPATVPSGVETAIVSGIARQRTLRNPISCSGVGLHRGQPVTLTFRPAPANCGIVFRRTDLGVDVPARFDHVVDTRLCTVLGASGSPEARVATVEHVMAALSACGIDNVLIELDGPEVPVLDGSSAPFVFLLDCAGRVEQEDAQRAIEVLRPVRVSDGEAFAELRPSVAGGFEVAASIAFAAAAIGRQSRRVGVSRPHPPP